MNSQLLQNNYIFIPNFIEKERAQILAKRFDTFCQKNKLAGDPQAPNSSSFYNYIEFVELLCEKTNQVSEILGQKVLPTYTYSRVYKRGDDLKRHRDRPACEISLTLNLFKQKDWPIYIQKPNGEEVSVEMEQGDAMMYLGCVSDHWRHEIDQDKYIQVFLHYVRSNGPYASAFFDKHKPQPVKLEYETEPVKRNNGFFIL
jgi:hypothetical protein